MKEFYCAASPSGVLKFRNMKCAFNIGLPWIIAAAVLLMGMPGRAQVVESKSI